MRCSKSFALTAGPFLPVRRRVRFRASARLAAAASRFSLSVSGRSLEIGTNSMPSS